MWADMQNIAIEPNTGLFSQGSVLREPIFYGGESAYDFQYLDFAPDKYSTDNTWLITNTGFTIEQAQEVIRNIIECHKTKFINHFEDLKNMHPDTWTMLPAFIFTLEDLTKHLNIDRAIIKKVLLAFSLTSQCINKEFITLSDFNITNACPLLALGDKKYLLFQHYSRVESLYESPFYWMNNDKKYLAEASKNRGDFVENFSANKLKRVFGEKKVFMNLDIYDPSRPKVGDKGEIDVLVVFGNRAIILQAKSKRRIH